MACAAALNLVSASSSSSLRLSICCMAASWLRCSTRIVRCCLGMALESSALVLGLDHENARRARRRAEAEGARRRLPVHVDVVAIDGAAGVLGDKPAAVA